MKTITQKIRFVLAITLATLFVLAAHVAVAGPSAALALPNISTGIDMVGSSFSAKIVFHLNNAGGITAAKQLFQDPKLMEQLSTWVQGASYSAKSPNGRYTFALTLGKYGHNYTIQYGCVEHVDASSWVEQCGQLASSSIMNNGSQQIRCESSPSKKNSKANGVDCEMNVAGQMESIGVWPFKYSGPQVAYTYYTEMTSYVSKIALISGHNTNGASGANALMAQNIQLQGMMADLKAKAQTAASLSINQKLTAYAVCPNFNFEPPTVAAVLDWSPGGLINLNNY